MKATARQSDSDDCALPCAHSVVLAKPVSNSRIGETVKLAAARNRPQAARRSVYDFVGIAG